MLPLKKAKCAELATEGLGHVLGARRGAIEVAGTILLFKIEPSLKGAPRSRLHQREPRPQHQIATRYSRSIDEWTHVEQQLSAGDFTADHPIQRSPVTELLRAPWHHARAVNVFARKPPFAALREFLSDPVLKLIGRIAADAELDEVQGHAASLA